MDLHPYCGYRFQLSRYKQRQLRYKSSGCIPLLYLYCLVSLVSDSLCSDMVQLQTSGAQLSVQLLNLAIVGGRELPDPPVLFH